MGSEVPASKKLDGGKPMMHLLPWAALEGVAHVMRWAIEEKKPPYPKNGWRWIENGTTRYVDAAIRHLAAFSEGEKLDKESKLDTLAHAAASCLMALWHHTKEKQK